MNKFLSNFLKNKNITVNPVMLKIITEWGFSILIAIGGVSYSWAVHKSNKIANDVQDLKNTIISYHQENIDNFEYFNDQINKMYDKGYKLYDDNQKYEQRQYNLLIDYGTTNKNLLKQILQDNQQQKNQEVQEYVDRSKSNIGNYSITAKKKGSNTTILTKIGRDTTFMVKDVDLVYINNYLKIKYNIKEIKPTSINSLFNVIYSNK